MNKELQIIIIDELKARKVGMTKNSLIDHILLHHKNYQDTLLISSQIDLLCDEGKLENNSEFIRVKSIAYKNAFLDYLIKNWIAIVAIIISIIALFK